ncbi:hypothetical protein GA512_00555 [Bacillus paralicheniformis]|nr:RHS repeat-associated core domain-containing protein [Bacillus paralicheniformis]MPQ23576.1 hypothetical protein [Bacillus paralicheniformis]
MKKNTCTARVARHYEPENGVFLSLDPDPGSEGDSLDQNGYAYGNNNPVMNVDPDGKEVLQSIFIKNHELSEIGLAV